MTKMRFYYILTLICLPLLTQAQQSVPAEKWDSMVAEDMLSTAEKREAAEVVADAAIRKADSAVQQHYLWDQAVPAMADTMETYADYSLVIRHVPDTMLNVLKTDKDLQYVLKKKEAEKTRDNSWLNKIILGFIRLIALFPMIIVIIVIACVGLLLYLYLKQNGYLFKKTSVEIDKTVRLTDEELDVDTYHQQIEQAVNSGRLRVAVRLLYLQTLRILVDKQIVTYSREKTNAAYLRSMVSTPWYKAFAMLTLDYEYIWYGDVPVNDEQFKVIHRQFRQFMNELGYTR
jgi:hypothetical protein